MAIPLVLKKFLVRTRLARFVPGVHRLTDGGTEYLRYYSDRVLAAPVTDLLDPAAFPAGDAPGVIDLNLPAPRFDSPATAVRLAADRGGVPPAWGLPELRDRIADTGRVRHGRPIDPRTEVLVTRGATGAFAAVLDAFVNPGDRVALLDPGSPMFAAGVRSRRGRIRWVPTQNEDGQTRFPADALKTALRGATLLALSDPGNPTGGTLSEEDQEQILWWANRYDVLVYLDESFAPFRYSGSGRSLPSLPGADKRALAAGSVSQAHGLRSVRVGWLTGPRHLVKACALTAALSGPYVPAVCQRVAVRALETGDETSDRVREQFRDRRRYVLDRLRGMGLEPIAPAGGYFLWVPVSPLGLDGRTFADRLLKEHGVRVGPGSAFGPSGSGHVRISFAAEDGRLREGLTRLAVFVAGLRGEPVEERLEVEGEPVEDRLPSFSRV